MKNHFLDIQRSMKSFWIWSLASFSYFFVLSLLYFGNGLLDVDFLSRLIDFFILFFGCSIRLRLLSFVRELNRVSLT